MLISCREDTKSLVKVGNPNAPSVFRHCVSFPMLGLNVKKTFLAAKEVLPKIRICSKQ